MLDKEDLASQLLETIPGVAFRFSHEGDDWRTWFVTQNIKSMLGYEPEELLQGKLKWLQFVHPDDRVVLMKQINDYEARGIDEFKLFYRVVKKNGDSLPVTEYNTVRRDDKGNVVCYDTVLVEAALADLATRMVDDHYRQQIVLNDILVSLYSSDLDHALQIILDRTGAYLNTSRALLFQDSPDHKTCKIVYEWCNNGITSVKDLDYVITYSTEMPEIYVALQDTGVLLVNHGEIPENCKEEFEHEGLLASAIFAVYLHGEHYGFVCFDDCVLERVWDEETARFLKNIANIISAVLLQQQTAKNLEISRETLRTVLDNVDSYIFAVNSADDKIIFANQAFQEAFGKDSVGHNYKQYLDIALESCANLHQGGCQEEIYSEKIDKWLQVASAPVDWIDGQQIRLVTCYDVTAKKKYADAVEKIAYLDHLTGLPNRYKFNLEIKNAMQEAKVAHSQGYVLFIDLDDFKIVNDLHGHDYGDALLVTIAQFLKEHFAHVYRFGGDEFVIIISHQRLESKDELVKLLLDRSAEAWPALDKQFHCTLSIGEVEFSGNEDDKEIVKQADMAMYEAKHAGKNLARSYHQGLSAENILRNKTENLLRQAMKNNFEGFRVYYQPFFDRENKQIVGAEALLRLVDGDQLLLPADFISLADYLGFMVPIGEFVLTTAARCCQEINQTLSADFKMMVNLSERQLKQKNIITNIKDIFAQTGVQPDHMKISLHENVGFENIATILTLLKELRQINTCTVIDHFGKDSLSYMNIADLPVEMISTAPGLLHNLGNSYVQAYIKLIVDWCHSRKIQLCLSGIESKAQATFAEQVQADFVQGFYYSPPCEEKMLKTLMRND